MREDPSLGSLLCGARALNSLGIALGSSDLSVREVLQDATPLDAQGFTLGRLQQIGQRHGVALQAAVRGPGAAWVTPAVVRWTEDLWRTVLAVQGPGFWVDDPTRGRVWMSAEHLEQEVSGYCVVRSGALPPGWRAATSAEAAQVVGRSYAGLDGRDYPVDSCRCPAQTEGNGIASKYLTLGSLLTERTEIQRPISVLLAGVAPGGGLRRTLRTEGCAWKSGCPPRRSP